MVYKDKEKLTDTEQVLRIIGVYNGWYSKTHAVVHGPMGYDPYTIIEHTYYNNGDFAGDDYYEITPEMFKSLIDNHWIEGKPEWGYTSRYEFVVTETGINHLKYLADIKYRKLKSEEDRIKPDEVDGIEVE